MKKSILSLFAIVIAALGASALSAHPGGHGDEKAPSTVLHVVTVSWKAEATDAQIQAALEGVKTLAKEYDGIKRVWTKTLKAQGNRSHAIGMEFKSEQALKDYADSDAQKNWYKVYRDIREGSTTFDITN